MDVEITQRREVESQEITVWGRIAEPEPRPTRDGRTEWIPTKVKIVWARYATNGGAWTHWTPSITVTGPKLRRSSGEEYGQYIDLVEASDPDWKAWVDELHPSGDGQGYPERS